MKNDNVRIFLLSISIFSVLLLGLNLLVINKPTIKSDFNTSDNKIKAKQIISSGTSNDKTIYLTFDDGYNVENTYEVLNILDEYDIYITFFITNEVLETTPKLVVDILSNGHIVGLHDLYQTEPIYKNNIEFKKYLETFEKNYQLVTGQLFSKIYRPASLSISNEKMNILEELKYSVITWTNTYYDFSSTNDVGKDYIYNQVIKETSNGSIIALHTLSKSNVVALPKILDYFIKYDYEFGSIIELI